MATINIAYNGATLASLSGGQAATLKCAGQTMNGNIVLTFGIAGSVEYNGKVTALNEGDTATLECAGRKMLSDVVVTASGTKGEATLIEKEITANGEYPASADGADGYSKVVVNVAGGSSGGNGVPIVITSAEEANAIMANPAENVGKIFIVNGMLFTIVEESDE